MANEVVYTGRDNQAFYTDTTLDLNDNGAVCDELLEMGIYKTLSVGIEASPWTTARVELKFSLDGTTWYSMASALILAGPGPCRREAVNGYRFMTLQTTTPEGGASIATVRWFVSTL